MWPHARSPDAHTPSSLPSMLSFQSPFEVSSRLALPEAIRPSYDHLRQLWSNPRSQSDLSLRPFVLTPGSPPRLDVDYLVKLMGEAQRDPSPFGAWVFEQSARILLDTEPNPSYVDNNEFTHAAKYLFLGACFNPPFRTLLDTPDTVPLATSLVNLASAFCESSSSLGTTPLIIRSIMVVNLRDWVERRDLAEFSFKPQGLAATGFLDLVRAQTIQEERERPPAESGRISAPFRLNQAFCEASSPVEFLLWVFEKNIVVPRSELLPDVRRLLVEYLGPHAARYPFLASGDASHGERVSKSPQREFAPGYYFDVFGTLIHHDGTPNTRLIQRMIDLWKGNVKRPVYLVSDSQPEEVKRALAFLTEMPPLLPKESLYGRELECLIDNCGPEGQGLRAKHHLSPEVAVASGIVVT